MSTGGIAVTIATVSALAAAATRAGGLRSKDDRLVGTSLVLSLITFVSVTSALVILSYCFLTGDYSYYYVWSNSSNDLPALYKLSGVWAGAEGSFLFWTWLMTLVLAVEVVLEPRRSYLSRRFHGVFQVALAGTIFGFLLILMDMDVFRATNPLLLEAYPNGYGLNLALQTPEMAVHPPVVFAGYAFCLAAFAGAAAHFLTAERNWFVAVFSWTRLSWIFLTLGIGIGAIWAYYVLGWGGYWAWDPVETSSLVPWLLVTAFLHTLLRHGRKGEYQVLSPALGMVSFAGVVFATFATRAGGIWTSSVHAFGGAVGASAGARLTYLLGHDSTVLGIFALMLCLLGLAMYLAYSRYRELGPAEPSPEPDRLSGYISDRNNMLLTVLLLIVTTAVMLLLMFKNVEVSQTANYAEFNQKMSIFFVAVMVTMSVCLVWKALGRERAFWLAVAIIAVSAALAVVGAASAIVDGVVAFSLPSYVAGVAASLHRLARSAVRGSLRKSLYNTAPHVIHLGIALVLFSYVISSNMQTFPEGADSLGGAILPVGGVLHVGDYAIRLVSLAQKEETGTVGGLMIDSSRDAIIEIARSGKVVREGVVLSNLYGHDLSGSSKLLEVEVYVYKTVLEDLYINYQWLTNASAFVQAKIVPMMNILWSGFALLVLGLALRMAADRPKPSEAAFGKNADEPHAEPAASEPEAAQKDYEAMVEAELEKLKAQRRR